MSSCDTNPLAVFSFCPCAGSFFRGVGGNTLLLGRAEFPFHGVGGNHYLLEDVEITGYLSEVTRYL